MLLCHWKLISLLDGSVYVRFKKLNKEIGISACHTSLLHILSLQNRIVLKEWQVLQHFLIHE